MCQTQKLNASYVCNVRIYILCVIMCMIVYMFNSVFCTFLGDDRQTDFEFFRLIKLIWVLTARKVTTLELTCDAPC